MLMHMHTHGQIFVRCCQRRNERCRVHAGRMIVRVMHGRVIVSVHGMIFCEWNRSIQLQHSVATSSRWLVLLTNIGCHMMRVCVHFVVPLFVMVLRNLGLRFCDLHKVNGESKVPNFV